MIVWAIDDLIDMLYDNREEETMDNEKIINMCLSVLVWN
jgi:hypothetical protein